MIAAALLLAAAQTATDVERAFDRLAAREGQWTAFRAYADAGAIMFVPRPINAQEWLRDRKDPPKSTRWQPIRSYVACDGVWAANTGAWQRPDGSVGYFTTIWHRGTSGRWRWVLDHGDALAKPRRVPARPVVRQAVCGGKGRVSPAVAGADSGIGTSDDATLCWRYKVQPDGARTVRVELWNGHGYDPVIADTVAAQ